MKHFFVLVFGFGCLSCNSGYQINGEEVIYQSWTENGRVRNPIPDADAASFKELSPSFGRDRSRVYYEGQLIPQARPASFRLLDHPYSKDDLHVFFMGDVIKDAEAGSFSIINGEWSKDKTRLFNGAGRVPVCDLGSFAIKGPSPSVVQTVFSSGDPGYDHMFARDKRCLYFAFVTVSRIEIRSPETFEWLDPPWSKDAQVVYFQTDVVVGADPKTFKATGMYARDKEHCFVAEYKQAKRVDCKAGTFGF